ncbi:MAG: right-handed parallel beta-helix repeat-containing protein [Verrucomicrobia bacterium]|nr:right-handed parallel beta-helix repeat-containing protein [Verrucomicrobiota bacterium]
MHSHRLTRTNTHTRLSAMVGFCAILSLFAPACLQAAPVADAGPDSVYGPDVPIILDGSQSTSDRGPLTYLWEQINGDPVELIGQDRAIAMVMPTSATGPRVFRLSVSTGNTTATDDVAIAVMKGPGRILYVDNQLGSNCLNNNYSIAKRDGSGSDGNAYASLQEAADVVLPGDTVYVRAGTYPNTYISNKVYLETNVSQSGTAQQPIRFENHNGEKVILSGFGFQDADLDGDGFADGPIHSSKRETLFKITGDYIQVVGLEFTNSQQNGLSVHGSFCYITECVSHDNWGGNASLESTGPRTLRGNVFRRLECYRSRHNPGFGMFMNSRAPGLVRDNAIVECLFYNNGYQPDGKMVSKAFGDSSGGGNSDGFVVSKVFAEVSAKDKSVENYAPNNFLIRNIAYHNADDGIDVSFADSLLEDNMAIENGPEGGNGFKVFRPVSGLVYRGNLAYGNHRRGFELREAKGGSVTWIHNTSVRNTGVGVYGPNAESDVRNNLLAFNGLNVEFGSATGKGGENWASDGKNVDKNFSGDPELVNDRLTLDMEFNPESSVGSKWEYVVSQIRRNFTPKRGSGLIDNGKLIEGYHCPRADDDKVSPMSKDAPGRHWSGKAPDIGAFEYQPIGPKPPSNLRVVIKP